MQTKTIPLIMTFLVSFLNAPFAQELTIKSLSEDPHAIIAVEDEKRDLAGKVCGLVKVQLPVEGAVFEGCVTTVNKIGEYWVYMEDGSYMLTVKHAKFHPLSINFRDHGIERIEGKRTYILSLLIPESIDNAKQQFTIRYTPQDAIVIIDSKPYHGSNGVVTASLPVGQHDYLVTASGYEPVDGSIRLKVAAPSTIRIDLGKTEKSTSNNLILHSATDNASVTTAQHSETANTNLTKNNIETFTVKGVSFNMVRVEGGTFTMGATHEQGSNAYDDEKPTHQVTLSTYSIGETEVTQALWQAVMGSNPSNFYGSNLPVERVSWNDCQTFLQRLNQLSGRRFRLPTEAEWEYAARGGNKSQGFKYSGSNQAGDVAWVWENCGDKPLMSNGDSDKLLKNNCRTHDVKTKRANELGIYDMSGNVWEWCQDWYDRYSSGSQTNPTGPFSGSFHVIRGGSWYNSVGGSRVATRARLTPDDRFYSRGLRLAL